MYFKTFQIQFDYIMTTTPITYAFAEICLQQFDQFEEPDSIWQHSVATLT